MDRRTLNIALLEDDLDYSRVLNRFFRKSERPFRLKTFENLEDLTNTLKLESFDLILTDLNVNDSQGIETFRAIKSQIPGLPIVVISNHDGIDLGEKCLAEGAQDYLVKSQIFPQFLVRSCLWSIERHRQLTTVIAPTKN